MNNGEAGIGQIALDHRHMTYPIYLRMANGLSHSEGCTCEKEDGETDVVRQDPPNTIKPIVAHVTHVVDLSNNLLLYLFSFSLSPHLPPPHSSISLFFSSPSLPPPLSLSIALSLIFHCIPPSLSLFLSVRCHMFLSNKRISISLKEPLKIKN